MIRAAKTVYLLADSSKFGYSSFASLGRISLVDAIICDDKIPDNVRAKLKEMSIGII